MAAIQKKLKYFLILIVATISFSPSLYAQADDEEKLTLEDDYGDGLVAEESNTTTQEVETGFLGKLETSSGGEITVETRVFEDDNNASTKDHGAGIFSRLEQKTEMKPFTAKARVAGRVDSVDSTRNFVFIEELYIGIRFWRFNLKAGSQLYNWTATEAFHPADQLNSRNFDSNIENAEKFGEPSISLETEIPRGTITLYYMPYYRLPRFPGLSNRLAFFVLPSGLSLGGNIKIDHDGNESTDDYGHQGAIEAKFSLDKLDLALHGMSYLARNYAQPVISSANLSEIRIMHLRFNQAGATAAYALEGFIFKTETAYRVYQDPSAAVKQRFLTVINGVVGPFQKPDDHFILALGIEYGWQFRNGIELTVLSEAQRYFLVDRNMRAQLDIFQADILVGTRLAFNDVNDKTLFFAVIGDFERREEFLVNLSYSQRINEEFKIALGARRVLAKQKGSFPIGLEGLDGSNQYYINLTRSF